MKKLLDTLTQAALLVFFRLAFFRLAFFPLAFFPLAFLRHAFFPLAFLPLIFLPLSFLLLAGCGEIIHVSETSAKRPALELAVGSGGEWTEAIAFTARLAEATTKDVTFSYATELDGTAGEDDLVSVTGKATIAAGETEVSVIVQIIDDYQDDNDETFSFVLSKANTELINGKKSITATATILDDDYSYTPLQLAQFDDVSIKEGDGYTINRMTFDIILNRSVLAHENVSFDYIVIGETAQDNEDYISIVDTADISYSDRASLSVSIVGDYVAEDQFETFRLVLSSPVGFEITPEVDGVAVGTIIDNDMLMIESFNDVVKVEGDTNSNMVFDVILSRPVNAGETVSLNYVVEDGTARAGSDYIAVGETSLSFGASKDRATIAIEIIGDTVDDNDYEIFTVELSELVGIATSQDTDLVARGLIQDDDGAEGLTRDNDGNGLIDIYDAYMLDKIRYNLRGTSYKTSESATGITRGCPDSGCYGYELMNDINLPSTNWVPIGDNSNPFTATLDGNGYTINNLNISSGTDRNKTGFIGVLGGLAGSGWLEWWLGKKGLVGILQNLNFAAGSVSSDYQGTIENQNFLGGVVGHMHPYSAVTNVSSALSVSATNVECYYVGGLVGKNSFGVISKSSSSGNVDVISVKETCPLYNTRAAGGLVGYSSREGRWIPNYSRNEDNLFSSYATGNVTLNGRGCIGGLVGLNNEIIKNSYATGSVTLRGSGRSDFLSGSGAAGGLVGVSQSGYIYDSHTGDMVTGANAGDVSGSNLNHVGGLMGLNESSKISRSYATGDIYSAFSGKHHPHRGRSYFGLGGLVGTNIVGKILNSYATGDVTGDQAQNSLGGLIGNSYPHGVIKNNYATGDVSGNQGEDRVGGLVGIISWIDVVLTNNHAIGNVFGNEGADRVGGLIGSFEVVGKIVNRDNYATGNVFGNEGNDYVGGLMGMSLSKVSSSYASGNVAGGIHEDFVGGLVGLTYSSVGRSYAIGTVDGDNGTDSVGGLVGHSTNIIRSSFATGIVSGGSGNDMVGGLAGETKNTASIITSYAIGNVIGNLGDDYVGGIVGRINLGSLKNSYAIGAVDGGAGTDDKIGFLTGFKGASADIAGNYYLMGSSLTNGTALSLATTEARGKSKANLKALTIAITDSDFTEGGWSNLDWDLTADKYPSIKLYKEENGTRVEGDIICGQSSEHVQC